MGAHLFYNKQVYNSLVEDHVLLSSLELENINTVFHKAEEKRRSNLFAKCLRHFPPLTFCMYTFDNWWGGSMSQPAFSKHKRHQQGVL